MFASISRGAKVISRRIYGIWSDNTFYLREVQINKYSIKPVQKISLGQVKNLTGNPAVMDAMDILRCETITSFYVFSSEIDYSRIA